MPSPRTGRLRLRLRLRLRDEQEPARGPSPLLSTPLAGVLDGGRGHLTRAWRPSSLRKRPSSLRKRSSSLRKRPSTLRKRPSSLRKRSWCLRGCPRPYETARRPYESARRAYGGACDLTKALDRVTKDWRYPGGRPGGVPVAAIYFAGFPSTAESSS
ncbi:MAG: hypothetical protein EXR72_08860 [Myxococcales bacterium]|nr:hypothetical protein [Myxococcales bacterium]